MDMHCLNDSEVSIEEWEWRKSFFGFGPDDVGRLMDVKPFADSFVHEVVDELYLIFQQHEQTRIFIQDQKILTRLKTTQTNYFLDLFSCDYGEEYLRQRLRIGSVHHHIGLEIEWYLGAYTHYLRLVQPRLMELFGADLEYGLLVFDSMQKLITLDQSLAVSSYLASKELAIQEKMQISA